MRNSFKSLDVFEFKEEDELIEPATKMISTTKFGDQLTFGDHVSGGTEYLSKTIAAVICERTDAGSIDCNRNAAGSFTHLETEYGEHRSSLNRVLHFKFGSSEQSTENNSTIPESGSIHGGVECGSVPGATESLEDQSKCIFPELSCNGESVHLASDADASMSQRSSSPISDNSDSSDGPSSDKYYSGLDEDKDGDGIIFYPDYINYSGTHYLDSVVSFSRNYVEANNRNFNGDEGPFNIHLDIDDIVKIESEWSTQYETCTINIHFISKDVTQNDIVCNASGIQEFRFSASDSNWHRKLERIESLNARYKALWTLLVDTGMKNSLALPEEKAWMPPRSYFPNFNEPFGEVIYPKGDPDAVSISKRDVDLLRPDTFVNDTIIDFYIKYLKTKLKEEEKIKFHFFNSFFFRKLADMDKDPSSAQDGKAAFLRVRKWTRKVNFLEKDFIFIPVNYNYHWSLIVICYFGEAASHKDDGCNKSVRVPCVLHMDSIKGSHAGLKDLMQSYLWEEWKERKQETCENLYSKFKDLKFVSLELPQQQNLFDCGLFLLHYVELFLEEVPANFNIHNLTSSSKFLQADWFPSAEASLKRTHIERLINDLLDAHSEDGSSSGESAVHCSPDGAKTTNDYENDFELLEKPSALTSYYESSVYPETGLCIEMTLQQASPVRSTQYTRSSGLVLKELFESGSASESFSDAPWQDFEQKGCQNELIRPDSITEENVEASSCFVQTNLTGAIGFPCTSGELISQPSHLVPSKKPDSPPTGSVSHDASDVKANEKCYSTEAVRLGVELKKLSSEVTEQLTVSLAPAPEDMLNDAEFHSPVEIREGNESKNMLGLCEEANQLQGDDHATPDDMQDKVVNDELRSDSEEQRSPKRIRITPTESLT